MTLAGGTFSIGSYSEGSAGAVGIGALSLTASGSHLDFGAGIVGVLCFASFTPNSNALIIDNWTGTAGTVGSASTDRLIFASDQSSNLSDFSFTGFSGAQARRWALLCPRFFARRTQNPSDAPARRWGGKTRISQAPHRHQGRAHYDVKRTALAFVPHPGLRGQTRNEGQAEPHLCHPPKHGPAPRGWMLAP